MPTPNTSISTPWSEVAAVSASSRNPWTCWMKVEESSGVFISASFARSQASTSAGGSARSLVTTTQASSASNSFWSTFCCSASSSVSR